MLGVASLGGDTLIACQFQALPLVVVVPALAPARKAPAGLKSTCPCPWWCNFSGRKGSALVGSECNYNANIQRTGPLTWQGTGPSWV